MKNLIFLILMSLLTAMQAYAAKEVNNGGDMCENRIKSIRDDIKGWIKQGGSAGLNLPAGIDLSVYNTEMTQAMSAAKILCTTKAVTVGGIEKTCKNRKSSDGKAQILCNYDRFNKTNESDQYILVHHEFAGLAGLEVDGQDGSSYVISNQLSAFLQDQIIKKLVIVPGKRNACSALLAVLPGKYNATLIWENGRSESLTWTFSFTRGILVLLQEYNQDKVTTEMSYKNIDFHGQATCELTNDTFSITLTKYDPSQGEFFFYATHGGRYFFDLRLSSLKQ